jgi:outer membrane protein OmpA-like peptidoglycan-associated protein
MRLRTLTGALAIVTGFALAVPAPADAQIGKLKEAAERAVTDEAAQQVERLLREAIRCTLNDPVCPQEAEESGEEVIYVDEDGEVITDEDGAPITDRDAARERAGVGADSDGGMAPGDGVWANYDFVPGDEILYFDDYTGDRVGDFPRRMNFVRGNWEIVEWEDLRLLRSSGRGRSAVEIPLVDELPDRFTVEFDAYLPHGNHQMVVATSSPAADGGDSRQLEGNYFGVSNRTGAGVQSAQRGGVESTTRKDEYREAPTPIRIMVDGRYARVYVGSERVANIPNAELRLGDRLYIETQSTRPQDPIYIGPIRVAAGGPDLYDDLLADGRTTTRGILFAVDSDRIRPESTPTLQAIGAMLEEHPELRLRVEGHTDADGDEAHNQDLSERRAAAVKRYLVDRHGIEDGRLETAGLGESQPVADNRSAEGKQKNRRVELVRLDEGGTL